MCSSWETASKNGRGRTDRSTPFRGLVLNPKSTAVRHVPCGTPGNLEKYDALRGSASLREATFRRRLFNALSALSAACDLSLRVRAGSRVSLDQPWFPRLVCFFRLAFLREHRACAVDLSTHPKVRQIRFTAGSRKDKTVPSRPGSDLFCPAAGAIIG